MKPKKFSPAHSNKNLAEIVCSNSFKSNLHTNACGLLKEELRLLDSLLIKVADETAVPAGQALAVDREVFAEKVTEMIKQNPLIEIYNEEVTDVEKIAQEIHIPFTVGGGIKDITDIQKRLKRALNALKSFCVLCAIYYNVWRITHRMSEIPVNIYIFSKKLI